MNALVAIDLIVVGLLVKGSALSIADTVLASLANASAADLTLDNEGFLVEPVFETLALVLTLFRLRPVDGEVVFVDVSMRELLRSDVDERGLTGNERMTPAKTS